VYLVAVIDFSYSSALQESFYSKLKTFADEGNTNLYVSNLPKSMNEHELTNLFTPHKVCSSKILRTKDGHGRGVGFARFDTRDACEEVIKTFNNHTINANGEDLQIQIRYADTQEQKSLKQQTQAARQFRSAEYEFATQAWRQGRLPYAGTTMHETSATNEFEQYLGTTANAQGQRWIKSAIKPMPRFTSEVPSYQPSNKGAQAAVVPADARKTEPGDNKPPTTAATTDQVNSPVDSVAASEQD
jgi:RNA recognition motif-containing protein